MLRTSRKRRPYRLAIAAALIGLIAALGETEAKPRAISMPAKFAGAFVNWGPVGREHTLQQWENG